MAARVPALLGTNWHQRGLAQIEWQSTNQQVMWKALPFITPFVRPVPSGTADFLVAGLFPPAFSTNTVPAELLAQFVGRTNALYYDWEITQARLEQWRMMVQLFAVISERPQFTTNTAALPWLMGIEKHLGNSVTEVVAESPREWLLTRKSHLGLTGVELIAFARWLESVEFPCLSLELPADPRLQRRKASAKP
jgi:hypothetical protein